MAPRTRKRTAEDTQEAERGDAAKPPPAKKGKQQGGGGGGAGGAGGAGGGAGAGEAHLTTALKDECTCAICTEITECPASLPCGHTFCLSCIRQSAKGPAGKKCPTCRGTFSAIPAPNRATQAMVTAYLKGLGKKERQEELDRRLILAIEAYQPARVAELLALGADADAVGTCLRDSGKTLCALNIAYLYCEAAAKGEQVEGKAEAEHLMVAQADIVQHLMKAGAETDGGDLQWACYNAGNCYEASGRDKWEAIALELLERGCKPTADTPRTILFAVIGMSEQTCLRLLELGATVGYSDKEFDPDYATWRAARRGFHDLVYALVSKGAAVGAVDEIVRNSYWKGWQKAHPGQVAK